MYDVVIIGAGVVGCAIARELSRRDRKIAVLEKAEDVCEGTSKANSGIVHAGFDAVPGSMKARMNLRGSLMMEALSRELDFAYKRNGSLVLCLDEDELGHLKELYEKSRTNGVEGCRILTTKEVLEMEPQINPNVVAALYAPTGGIVCPFELTMAFAENACINGVEFLFSQDVKNISRAESRYEIRTSKEKLYAKMIVNAAGLYSDEIHNMVSKNKYRIIQRKGEYCLLDKKCGEFIKKTIFQLPTKYGKGILVTPTVHGNLLVGPTATDIPQKDAVNTTAEKIEELLGKAKISTPNLPVKQVITSFAGLRAHLECGDFVIEEAPDAPGFIDVLGIESPGLSSAPAIGVHVAQMIQERMPAAERPDFIAARKGVTHLNELDPKSRKSLIAEQPAYANVICRCETVTEGEILDAIHRPLGAKTLDGVKRRTRAGMGRCQSGFCSPKTVDILARELDCDPQDITKKGAGSYLLTGWNKEV